MPICPSKKTSTKQIYMTAHYCRNGIELVLKKFAITHRNRFAVNESDYVIAYVRTTWGGAYEAIQYAKRQRKHVINLADG